MVKVRFIKSVSSISGSYGVNQIVDINKKVAKSWVDNGWCEPVEESEKKAGKK